MKGPYRDSQVESIDSLKARIAQLEGEKDEVVTRREKKLRRKEWFSNFWKGFLNIFFEYRWSLRNWVFVTLLMGLVVGVSWGAVSCDKHLNEKTRKFIRGEEPPPIGCADIGGESICITHDCKLLACDWEGCTKPSMIQPEDF